MTDRAKALTVVLKKDYREDDIEELCKAIRLFTQVASVAVNVADPAHHIAVERAKHDIKMDIIHLIV